jgi:hypothetical protein
MTIYRLLGNKNFAKFDCETLSQIVQYINEHNLSIDDIEVGRLSGQYGEIKAYCPVTKEELAYSMVEEYIKPSIEGYGDETLFDGHSSIYYDKETGDFRIRTYLGTYFGLSPSFNDDIKEIIDKYDIDSMSLFYELLEEELDKINAYLGENSDPCDIIAEKIYDMPLVETFRVYLADSNGDIVDYEEVEEADKALDMFYQVLGKQIFDGHNRIRSMITHVELPKDKYENPEDYQEEEEIQKEYECLIRLGESMPVNKEGISRAYEHSKNLTKGLCQIALNDGTWENWRRYNQSSAIRFILMDLLED